VLQHDPLAKHELGFRGAAAAATDGPEDGVVVEVVCRQEEVADPPDDVVGESGPVRHTRQPAGHRWMIEGFLNGQ